MSSAVPNSGRPGGPGSQLILAMRLDGDIGRGVSHARQAVAIAHLVIIQERLIRLVDRARDDLASAARAGASTTRVWELQALLLGLVQNVDVLRALELLSAIRSVQGHLVVRSNARACWHAIDDG